MKKIVPLVFLALCSTVVAYGQSQEVEVTRDRNDVEGLEKVKELNVQASAVYGSQSKLRKRAIEKLKYEASREGITIVLIEVDEFSISPINNVNLIGTGYKGGKTKRGTAGDITEKEIDWHDVEVTRDRNDVVGLDKIKELNVESSQFYGSQSNLRKSAIEKIKREAAKYNISIVLIELDEFSKTPINNVNLIGTGYRRKGEID